ncbi:hypothetical protein ACHAWF_005074 [Thalassiosira exigua]
MCNASVILPKDCERTNACSSDLMNWVYFGRDNKPYPKFDVDGFRQRMRNKRIIFIGDSLARQPVQALIWTLGYENVIRAPASKKLRSYCAIDAKSNITMCFKFLGTMAAKIYQEGNYTLNHTLRGRGDTSHLLNDEYIEWLSEFDLAFVQSVAWWTGLPTLLNSRTSPSEWVSKMLPTLYYDAMYMLLSNISQKTPTVFVLGQTGTDCRNKNSPEPFNTKNIPETHGWNEAPKLWESSLTLINENALNIQVVDVREPLMQSVHAHPGFEPFNDCLHFCMNSAAINVYLDTYWVEVFETFTAH